MTQMPLNKVNLEDLASGFRQDSYDSSQTGPFYKNPLPKPISEKPSLAGALFRTENIIGSAIEAFNTNIALTGVPSTEGYNWEDGVAALAPDLFHKRYIFMTDQSEEETMIRAERWRKKEQDKAYIAESPFSSLALGAIMAPLDPTTYLPGGVIYKEAKTGYNVGRSAISVAVANMGGALVQESILYTTQQERTLSESTFNILGAGILGAPIGGYLGYKGGIPAAKNVADFSETLQVGLGEPKRPPITQYTPREDIITRIVDNDTSKYLKMQRSDLIDLAKKGSRKTKVTELEPLTLAKNETLETITLLEGKPSKSSLLTPSENILSKPVHGEASPVKQKIESVYSKMSDDELIEVIEANNKAIDVHNQINAEVRRRPLGETAAFEIATTPGIENHALDISLSRATIETVPTQNTNVYKKMSRNELRKILDKSDELLTIAKKHAPIIYEKMSREQATILIQANNKTQYAKLPKEQILEVAMNRPEIVESTGLGPHSVGAAESTPGQISAEHAKLMQAENLAGLAEHINKFTSLLSPRNSMMNSPFVGVRQLADMFFESNWIKNKYLPSGKNEARSESIETEIKKGFGRVSNAARKFQDIFYQQAGINKGPFKPERAAFKKEGLDWEPFNLEVSRALRNGDEHPNSHVEAAAKLLRKEVFEPLKEQAITLGRLPENIDVTTADSYLMREFNRQYIKENQTAFYNVIQPWFKEVNEQLKEALPMIRAFKKEINDSLATSSEKEKLIKEFEDDLPKVLKNSDGELRKVLSDEQLVQAIEQTIDNVLGRNEEKLLNPMTGKLSIGGKASPLQNRAWLIPDNIIEDFTNNNALDLAENYAKYMIPELELDKFARRILPSETINGKIIGPTANEAQGKLLIDLKKELDRMKAGANQAESARLEKAYTRAENDINDSINILKGIYGNGNNTLNGSMGTFVKNVKTWNFLRLMGYMTISSLPDVAMHIMRHGPGAFMMEGISPILRGLNNLQFNKDLLQDLGRCLEVANGSKLKSFMSQEATTVYPGRLTRGLDYLSNRFGSLTLMNQWQDMHQFMAGNMSMSRTLRNIDNWKKTGIMSETDHLRLNALGLGEQHWNAIHREWKRNGGIDKGSYWSDYGKWDISNKETSAAFERFKSSIITEVDSTNIKVGLGDKPRIAYDPYLNLLLQFKSFQIAATNSILTAGLSRNDTNFYMGVVSSMAMGALGYVIASKLKRPDEEVDLSFGKVSLNAFDRSGMGGAFMEGWNMFHKFIPIGGQVSRYQSRGKIAGLLGPTLGLFEDVAEVMNAATESLSEDGETMSTKDIQKIKRLAPMQNLFWLDNISKQLLNKGAVALGAEEP